MKQLLISLTIFLLTFESSYSQTGKIKYIFPDSVEIKAEKYIQEYLKHEPKATFYLKLSHDLDTVNGKTYLVYFLEINWYAQSGTKYSSLNWVKNSTRYGLINTTLYPLILDYDYAFSTVKDNQVGEFGKRKGEITRIVDVDHFSYTITFHSNGEIIREGKY